MSQNLQVLAYINEHGSITPMDALSELKCFRLAARVNQLRDKGHKIQTEIVRSGDKRYAKYRLIK